MRRFERAKRAGREIRFAGFLLRPVSMDADRIESVCGGTQGRRLSTRNRRKHKKGMPSRDDPTGGCGAPGSRGFRRCPSALAGCQIGRTAGVSPARAISRCRFGRAVTEMEGVAKSPAWGTGRLPRRAGRFALPRKLRRQFAAGGPPRFHRPSRRGPCRARGCVRGRRRPVKSRVGFRWRPSDWGVDTIPGRFPGRRSGRGRSTVIRVPDRREERP